jgi:hypothetical protein
MSVCFLCVGCEMYIQLNRNGPSSGRGVSTVFLHNLIHVDSCNLSVEILFGTDFF